MGSPGRDLSDEVKKFDPGVTCDVPGQVKHNMWYSYPMAFPFIAFPPQNTENKRLSSLWIHIIRVCGISKHRP